MNLVAVVLVSGTLLAALTVNLTDTPPLWWDEGWTLSVARNWVEVGHYGRLLKGQLVPAGMEAAFPVTGTIALSFKLFGVGVYQARLVAVFFTVAAAALLFELTRRLFGRSIAIATLPVLVFMNGHVDTNPLIVGRQVLGETPALCFLLAGYLCFLVAGERQPFLFVPAAMSLWAVAFVTKLQLQPFWAASLWMPLLVALRRRHWSMSARFGVAFVGTVAVYFCFHYAWFQVVPSSTVSGLREVVGFALAKHVRISALVLATQAGMPLVFGTCWELQRLLQDWKKFQSHSDMVRLSLFVLVAGFFCWYVGLSIGWPRYMFPPAFLGSVFVSAMLYEWTNNFNWRYTVERAGCALKSVRVGREHLTALAAVLLITMSFGRTR